ncbi:hypothetical protein O181_105400 [Austropuccinia psidii MF-1]|uniref:Uncharacterized protein n=1 Tax=Austropuccinia psidii MF-1 TaxID=1389203 RepID=A0A9Q3PLL9_9BASI|nr:hypothetical protein [Austropuccinia psidii MF-1]
MSGKFSSRKTHLEDSRVAPHSPRSEPTSFNVNSESELINDNISSAEPFPSHRNRNLSIPIQELVQSSQRGAVGNMPNPLAGGHELLLTHQKLSGSGEDHRTLRRMEPIVLQRQGKKDKELFEKSKSFIHRLEERVGNDPSFGQRRLSGIYQLQKCPKTSPKNLRRRRKVSRAIRARAKAKAIGTNLTHKGTGYPSWNLQPWTLSSICPELLWNSQPKSRVGLTGPFHANNTENTIF